jgi:genome maintenance exonuclease 1
MAHDQVYDSKIKQGIIMVCTPDLYYQEFKVSGAELRSWKHKFLKRLDEYHEMMREPTINEKELLKEFEKDGK